MTNALERLIAEMAAVAPPDPPRFGAPAPSEGQAVAEWLSEVAETREAADAGAIAHRQLINAVNERLFGTTARALVAAPELIRRRVAVPVPASLRLRDLVPEGGDSLPADQPPAAGVPEWTSVDVRVIAPANPTSVIVSMHGGAFWMAGGRVLDEVESVLVDHIAVTANAAVLEIDYRLAPEHPYPAAIIDALVVLDAVRSSAFEGVSGPIGLLGASSGGNNMTMVARIEGMRGNEIAALALMVPSVLLTAGAQSAEVNPEAWEMRSALLRGYLGDIDPGDPWISPGVLDRLDGMPPTFAAVAEFDEVAAGGEELCAAIRAAGQEAEARVYPMTHVVAPPVVEAAFVRDVGAFLARQLRGV